MASLADYFERNRPRARYDFGDRVFGYWNKIPFIGTVANDNVIDEKVGPVVSIFLDLPLIYKKDIITFIRVKQKDITRLKSY